MAKITVGYAADGTAKDYTTLAAAYAAAAACDELEVWYSDQNNSPAWFEPISSGNATKAVSLTGALPGRKVSFVNTGWFYWLTGDLSGNTSRVTVKNIAITDLGYLGYGIGYNDSGTGGGGLTIENCLFVGQGYGILFGTGASGAVIVRNCLFVACDYAVYFGTPIGSIVGNTIVRCNYAIYGQNAWSGSILKNNLVLNCKVPFSDNYAWAYWVASHNVCDSATPPGTSAQVISRATARLMCDSPGGFDLDARLAYDSPLIGAGIAHTDMSSTDIDGKTRGTVPAIGCSEGATAYTDPGEAVVLDGQTYLFAGEEREGMLPASASAADIAAAVWDKAASSHVYAGTFGKLASDTKTAVDNLAIAGTAVLYAPTSATRDTGSNEGGDYTNLSARDDSNMVTGEVTSTPGMEVTVIRSSSEADEIPSVVNVYGYYKGVQEHHVEVRAWNYLTSEWDEIGLMINRSAAFEYSFPLNSAHHSATGEMKLNFLHDAVALNVTHRLYLDWISWQKVATNSTLGSDIAAIRSKTDNLPEFPANEETVSALPTIAEIMGTVVSEGFSVQDALATIEFLDDAAGNAAGLLAAQVGDGTTTVAESLIKAGEIHAIMGLDAASPVTATGDGVATKTLTVDAMTVTITPDGITRT